MEEPKKKEKLPIYLDEDGNRRDPNRSGSPRLCNAKSKRTGELCKNIARANGKCRNHGGNCKGATTPEGRKRLSEAAKARNFKTGEHAPIWFDMLSEDERDMLAEIPHDAEPLLEQEIKLTTIRERRMLVAINTLDEYIMNGQMQVSTVQETWGRQLKKDANGSYITDVQEDGSVMRQSVMVKERQLVIKEDPLRQKRDFEEALTRVQAHKAKLIELRHKLSEGNIEEEDGSLTALVSIIGKARNLRHNMTSRDDGNQVQ